MENDTKHRAGDYHAGRVISNRPIVAMVNEFRAFRFMEDLKICLIEIPVIFVYRKM